MEADHAEHKPQNRTPGRYEGKIPKGAAGSTSEVQPGPRDCCATGGDCRGLEQVACRYQGEAPPAEELVRSRSDGPKSVLEEPCRGTRGDREHEGKVSRHVPPNREPPGRNKKSRRGAHQKALRPCEGVQGYGPREGPPRENEKEAGTTPKHHGAAAPRDEEDRVYDYRCGAGAARAEEGACRRVRAAQHPRHAADQAQRRAESAVREVACAAVHSAQG
mmetsp:Transcript_23761/g.60044  ORF Transcript_23761/g.60044 Transcript_23761/m.60044 type:complete len:219 (-) Transcript_23761:1280-1936(-)